MKYLICFLLAILVNIPKIDGKEPTPTIPPFQFVKLNGTFYTNKNIPIGKPSMFYFFDISCSHCQNTMQLISKDYEKLSQTNLYLISMDRKDDILKFMKTFANNLLYKKNTVLLMDVKQEFIGKFNPRKYPAVFLYDKNKRLISYQDEENRIKNTINELKIYQ